MVSRETNTRNRVVELLRANSPGQEGIIIKRVGRPACRPIPVREQAERELLREAAESLEKHDPNLAYRIWRHLER